MNNLLTLPPGERRKIAERLWKSLAPVSSISKEEEETIALLEKRWQNIQNGKSKIYTSAEMKKMIVQERSKKRDSVDAYTIQYDDSFWQDIKNVINWYDAISPI